uniref:ABC transmembrane type-1 domain-containing protein n=1 Tax=Brassica oleracea var. oleracea TaxID=109376 RepID=A0A0D3AZ81_BRAOL
MICGSVGAMGNGVGLPLMTLLFGDLIDSFGQNQNNKDIVDVISKVCVKFVYLGLGTLGAAFLQVACWMITGERQAAARIRNMYLKTILRQDIGFFDVETNTGEVVGRMSGDTVLIQDAMGEKVGKFIQLIATFIGGFALAFAKGWLLTLVMLTSIPLLAMAGAAMAIIVTRASSQGQAAYAKAATVVEQTIGSIRTTSTELCFLLGCIIYERERSDKQVQKVHNIGVQIKHTTRILDWFRTENNVIRVIQQLCFGYLVWWEDDSRKRLYWWRCHQRTHHLRCRCHVSYYYTLTFG